MDSNNLAFLSFLSFCSSFKPFVRMLVNVYDTCIKGNGQHADDAFVLAPYRRPAILV